MNKTLNMRDYDGMGATIIMIDSLASDVPHLPLHLHRRWEYSMALKFLADKGIKTVVDAGGAGALFAPLAAVYGYEVTVVDPMASVKFAEIQGSLLELEIKSIQAEFDASHTADAVVAISTLEHIKDDVNFVKMMAQAASKAVFLTVDFSSDGRIYASDQQRTYTEKDMLWLAEGLRAEGFTVDEGDYSYVAPFIANTYTFASIGGVRGG